MKYRSYDAVVIGGGFFGLGLATFLASSQLRVILFERGPDLMQRASYVNQARVHNGYHYPRSILTALRSRVNFPRFIRDYPGCVVADFEKYYAIARKFSKVSARQFKTFMERIQAPIEVAPRNIKELFDMELIEEVFKVVEYAFDPVLLKIIARERLEAEGGEIYLNTRVTRLEYMRGGRIAVDWESGNASGQITTGRVLNCTYSMINELLIASGLPTIRLKHELTEMALIEPPEEVRHLGITVMCGPFFSTMPFPPRKLHTLSHVRYTPHCSWTDDADYMNAYLFFQNYPKESKYPHMIRDASRYIPVLSKSRYMDSLWEVKTVLPQSEVDDSRPILYKHDHGMSNLTCIMGGKIDNIFDAIEEYKMTLPPQLDKVQGYEG